ncbi:CdaR family transcriptional regulator [Bacillus salipaludis]|uniref:CdaR family transcriptional regulator n=1 Tax=Bacillus salipaludis TaxID=2547811 RepID=A0ABW8RMK6_9BACI
MITRELAEILVKETSKVLNLNINVMNDKGVIIATRDPSRLNSIHEGALEVVRTGRALEITLENQGEFRGTQQGINLPIHFQNEVAGVIGITGDPKMIGDRSGLVKMMAELLVKQAYIASQSEWRQRTKEMIIEELIKETPKTASIDRWLGLLEMKLNGPFAVSLIELLDESISSHLLIQSVKEVLGTEMVLAVFIDVNKLLLLLTGMNANTAIKQLTKLYKELEKKQFEFRLVYSTPFDEFLQTNQGYRECEIAMEISKFDKKKKMVSYVEIEPKALVHQLDSVLAKQFSDRVLNGDLIHHLETLQTFFDCNLNIKEAANKLFIHRNTLIYRLKKIKTESGYDPQNFKDAFALQMAIWVNEKNSSPYR